MDVYHDDRVPKAGDVVLFRLAGGLSRGDDRHARILKAHSDQPNTAVDLKVAVLPGDGLGESVVRYSVHYGFGHGDYHWEAPAASVIDRAREMLAATLTSGAADDNSPPPPAHTGEGGDAPADEPDGPDNAWDDPSAEGEEAS